MSQRGSTSLSPNINAQASSNPVTATDSNEEVLGEWINDQDTDSNEEAPLLGEWSNDQDTDSNEEVLGEWSCDQEAVRRALAYFIVVDGLPFKFVESEQFKEFMHAIQPKFQIPSSFTIMRDIFQLYLDEKKKLKEVLRGQRVCLTTNSWTSLREINYICLTVHFIDNDWRLNKKIISFCPLASNEGKDIGEAIERCLVEWGIDKVFTITMENTSSTNAAVGYMRSKLENWGTSITFGRYLHVSCVGHIVNLIVNDELKNEIDSIERVRAAVIYVRSSPSRWLKFKEYVETEKIQCESLLCLDVSTRWNSTYVMLNSAVKFEKVFQRFCDDDPDVLLELNEDGADGMPTPYDWENVRRLVLLLEHFYRLTLQISGSFHVTSNKLLSKIVALHCRLERWGNDGDPKVIEMAERMKAEYNKYWGNMEKVNKLIYIAVVLDPRYKLMYIEFAFLKMYSADVAATIKDQVREATYSLFNEYKEMYSPKDRMGQTSSEFISPSAMEVDSPEMTAVLLESQYKRFKLEIMGVDSRSDLDKYLADGIEEGLDDFDILDWWKKNGDRYPILSEMARDVLAIPISTVTSESAFSTDGQVLESFRSSLTPNIVQSLICTQDWLRTSSESINAEENLAELENTEQDLF